MERKWLILASVMLGSIMGPIDASVVNVVLPTIAEVFGTGISTAQWVPTVSYTHLTLPTNREV